MINYLNLLIITYTSAIKLRSVDNFSKGGQWSHLLPLCGYPCPDLSVEPIRTR